MVERRRRPCRLCVTGQAIMTELSLLVTRVCRAVEIRCVAIPARVRQARISIIGVALIARHGLMSTSQRKLRIVVAECRGPPCRGCMARSAIMPEVTQHMVRILGLGEIGRMARIAIRVLQLIISAHVAILTLNSCMPTGQRESRCRVVECGGMPRGLCMARQAVVTELPLLMIRICCGIECRCMTIPARVRQICILITCMTSIACQRLMRTDERVVCVRVIERRGTPCRTRVARSAIMIKVAQHVIRTLRLRKLRLVTWIAIRIA